MANRTKLRELSNERTSNNSVRTVYKSNNKEFIVKSNFIGGAALEDLLFDAIKRTYDNRNTIKI